MPAASPNGICGIISHRGTKTRRGRFAANERVFHVDIGAEKNLKSENPLARILCLGPVMYLGRISYSLYLTHAVSQRALKVLLPAPQFEAAPPWLRLSVFTLYLIALIAPAALLHHLVEEPARRGLRRLGVSRKPLQSPKATCS